MPFKKYTRKPDEVMAIEWTTENLEEFKAAFPGREFRQRKSGLIIESMGSVVDVAKGDYVVQSAEGVVYSVSKRFFEEMYW